MSAAPHIFDRPPVPEPEGPELEEAARHALLGFLGILVPVRAPSWHQILFGGHPISIKLPEVPQSVQDAIDRTIKVMPGETIAERAKELLDGLRSAKPQGTTPRSLEARKALPPPRDAQATWLRRVFLITAGPEALRLLAAAGYLTATDVATMEEAYPEGVDRERLQLMEAATALTGAAARGGHDADLPAWLNAQVLTMMGEHRPIEFFSGLYGGGGEPPKPKAPIGASPSKLVDNTRPAASPEDR